MRGNLRIARASVPWTYEHPRNPRRYFNGFVRGVGAHGGDQLRHRRALAARDQSASGDPGSRLVRRRGR